MDIQNIMDINRTFMVHVSLNWTDCGFSYLLVWSFSVRRAILLHILVSNIQSGLTLIVYWIRKNLIIRICVGLTSGDFQCMYCTQNCITIIIFLGEIAMHI